MNNEAFKITLTALKDTLVMVKNAFYDKPNDDEFAQWLNDQKKIVQNRLDALEE